MLIVYYVYKPTGSIVRHHVARGEYTAQQLEQLIRTYNRKTPLYEAIAIELEEGSFELYLFEKLDRLTEGLKEIVDRYRI